MKKAGIAVAVITAVALAAFLIYDGIFNKTTSADFFAMDTVISAEVIGADSKKCIAEIEEIITSLDSDILSRHNGDSEISILNKNRGGKISEKLEEYLTVMLDISRKSGGKFDFTLGAVSDLWSFTSNPCVPDEEALNTALASSGYGKITVSGNDISYASDNLILDFGSSGKGIALDEIKAMLDGKKVKEATVSVGGSVLIYGKEEKTVGIRDPYSNAGDHIAKITVSDVCISTSGSYERRFEENGKEYHHILDPETGYPVENNLISVTIISESGILSDCLSTACFVLGLEEGVKLAEEYGCEAVFVTADKKIYATSEIYSSTEITDDGYTLIEYEN